jgi:hypothetical protein
MATIRIETFAPEDLARLGSIFDEAWIALAPSLEHRGDAAIAAARGRLAGIMLELSQQQLVANNLKARALVIFHHSSDAAPIAQLESRA